MALIKRETNKIKFTNENKIKIILKSFLPNSIPIDLYKYFILYLWIKLDSILLSSKQKDIFINMVSKQLEIPSNKLQFNLLYRASMNGYKPNDWIKCCYNKGQTITLILNKYNNNLFGGYTSIQWTNKNNINQHILMFLNM